MEAQIRDLTVRDLQQIARNLGIRGYSRYNKLDLIRYILDQIPPAKRRQLQAELEKILSTVGARPIRLRKSSRKSTHKSSPARRAPIRIRYTSAPVYSLPAFLSGIVDQSPALVNLLRQLDIKTLLNFCNTSKELRMVYQALPDIQYKIKRAQVLQEGLKFVTTEDIFTLDVEENQDRLSLFNSSLVLVPDEIKYLTQLTALDLRNNDLVTLPDSIGDLKNLKLLLIGNNQIIALPDTIGNLTQLEILAVNNNQLSTLPKSITGLTSLQVLDLHENLFTTLQEEFYELPSLKDLRISENQLATIDPKISKIPLNILDIDRNQLTSFPLSIANITSLQKLCLSRNAIGDIPIEIGNLVNLTALYMVDTQIESIPASIGRLTNLEDLWINNNRISALPQLLTKLVNLKTLKASNNELIQLPFNIGQLTSLRELKLKNNNLFTLPPSFTQLTGLQRLDLRDNSRLQLDEFAQTFLDDLDNRGAFITI